MSTPTHAQATAEALPSEHRQRLLQGMARVVGSKGYGAATIADIVSEAAVSRRTFYEHFDTKADCLLALYEAVSLEGLAVLARQLDPRRPWREQVQAALTAYFTWMSRNPELLRTLFVDILALGPEGLKVRRRTHEQMAGFIARTVRQGGEPASPLPRALSVALVGGLHELILQHSESGDTARLADLAPVATELVFRVLGR